MFSINMHYNTTHAHALHIHMHCSQSSCVERPAFYKCFCTIHLDPSFCSAAGCPLYIHLHIMFCDHRPNSHCTLISSVPAAVLLGGPFSSVTACSQCVDVWRQADHYVCTCLLSGPLGCLVSVCPLLYG